METNHLEELSGEKQGMHAGRCKIIIPFNFSAQCPCGKEYTKQFGRGTKLLTEENSKYKQGDERQTLCAE